MLRMLNMRLTAFLLLLAFFQKMGLELWVHRLLHVPKTANTRLIAKDKGQHLQQVPCHCLDDTMMPFNEATPVEIGAPQRHLVALLVTTCPSTPSFCKIFPDLRGPPCIALL